MGKVIGLIALFLAPALMAAQPVYSCRFDEKRSILIVFDDVEQQVRFLDRYQGWITGQETRILRPTIKTNGKQIEVAGADGIVVRIVDNGSTAQASFYQDFTR